MCRGSRGRSLFVPMNTFPPATTGVDQVEVPSGAVHRTFRPRREAELQPEPSHLVLEELAERLDEPELHHLGEAADVVVALDRHRRPAGEADTLDHVRVQRALRQVVGAADLLCLGLEHIDELGADEFALLLGVRDSLERPEELLAGIDYRGVHETEYLPYAVGLPLPHQAGVDINRDQVAADGAGCKGGTDRTVNSTGQGHDHLVVPRSGLDLLY